MNTAHANPSTMQQCAHVDLTIVGAGPSGLFAAFCAGMRGLRTALVDSLPEVGGQITAMYPEKLVYDVAGMPAVTGRELVSGLASQAARFDPIYLLGQTATDLVRRHDGKWEITTSDGNSLLSGAVLITAGIGTFTPRPLPAARSFSGAGVENFVLDPQTAYGQSVVIVGGGDSAIDWAVSLAPIADQVTLVHRRTSFRAHASMVERARELGVTILTDAEVTAVRGDGHVAAVDVRTAASTQTLACDRLVVALGFTAMLGPLLDWGIDVKSRRHVPVGTTMATTLPGIYSAGDITTYSGKVALMATAFGEVATAVNNCALYLDPDAALFPGHSTDVLADEQPPDVNNETEMVGSNGAH